MAFHVSYHFVQRVRRTGGWSENFWNNSGALPTAFDQAMALRPLLTSLHGAQTVMSGLTVREDGNARIQKDIIFDDGTLPDNEASNSDYPTTSLLLQNVDATGAYKSRQWIKGIPDSIVVKGFYVVGAYDKSLKKFLDALKSGGAAWCMRVRLNAAAVPPKNVDGVSPLGVITITGHGYANNARVRMARVGGVPGINGDWKIYNVTADTFQLRGYVPIVDPPAWDGKGTARLITLDYPGIKATSLLGISAHQVGRPFDLLIGRRKTRRR